MSSSRALALSLFGLGLLTRFAYLTYPREVVFDEYHFGKFINGYITGARRPLALTIAHANGRVSAAGACTFSVAPGSAGCASGTPAARPICTC